MSINEIIFLLVGIGIGIGVAIGGLMLYGRKQIKEALDQLHGGDKDSSDGS